MVILGSGPNRIGQGIEFDYCCCHAAFALREEGVETVMVNCNPETVSTDYDTADRLYFEPLTLEDVLAIIDRERQGGGRVSCLVQFGGQTPLKLALALHEAGVPLIGTSADSIDLAEDRKRFSALLSRLGINQPASGTATSRDEAREVAASVGYPVVVRPSYVLGGRGMAIVYEQAALDRYMAGAVDASPEHPVLVDRFLEDAFELDVDARGRRHGRRGASAASWSTSRRPASTRATVRACCRPTWSPSATSRRSATGRAASRRALGVIGLMNIQFAIKDDVVYVLEVNPRASRTVPFLSKATGVPLAKAAARVMLGRTLADLGLTEDLGVDRRVREDAGVPVHPLPGRRHPARAGDEVHGRGDGLRLDLRRRVRQGAVGGRAGAARRRDGVHLGERPRQADGAADREGPRRRSASRCSATRGTAAFLAAHGLAAGVVYKVNEGRPNIADAVVNGRISLVINTPLGRASFFDDRALRRAAMTHGVPCITTLTGASAAVSAIRAMRTEVSEVRALQDYYAGLLPTLILPPAGSICHTTDGRDGARPLTPRPWSRLPPPAASRAPRAGAGIPFAP